MRRMLDPTTLGGGGGSTLYRHFITLNDNSKSYIFTFNYYNHSDSAITYSQLVQMLSNNGISGSGYYKTGGPLSRLYEIINEGELLIAQGITADFQQTRLNIGQPNITDKISQVI